MSAQLAVRVTVVLVFGLDVLLGGLITRRCAGDPKQTNRPRVSESTCLGLISKRVAEMPGASAAGERFRC